MPSLEAASSDAPFILEQDDFDRAVAWCTVEMPIAMIGRGACVEPDLVRERRLAVIRALPLDAIPRPIVCVSAAGTVSLLDGAHRLDVFAERGYLSIQVLARLDFDPFFIDKEFQMAQPDVSSTASAIDDMARRMDEASKEMARIAKSLRSTGDLELAGEAVSTAVNLMSNLRLDLLVQRPLRSLRQTIPKGDDRADVQPPRERGG